MKVTIEQDGKTGVGSTYEEALKDLTTTPTQKLQTKLDSLNAARGSANPIVIECVVRSMYSGGAISSALGTNVDTVLTNTLARMPK